MIITNTVNTDLWIRERTQEVYAVQGDSCTRKIIVKLFANREPWSPEADVSVVIRYHKPDGTGGSYDTLPDGEKAWELTDNAVSFVLAPQVLAVPGRVAVQVELLGENGVLASFPLHVLVEENVAAGATSSGNYFSWEQRLERELLKTLGQAKESGDFTGATPQLQIGTVSTLNAGEPATATIHGTPEFPILDLALPRGADATADGKAPAGYGLGEEYPRDIDGNDCNNALLSGLYWISINAATKNCPTPTVTWPGIMEVASREGGHKTQTIHYIRDAQIHIVHRTMYNGIWGTWEWDNPPMMLEQEYCTTERWNGAPVYAKVISFGELPNASKKTVEHGISGMTHCIRLSINSSAYILTADAHVVDVTTTGTNISITTDFDYSNLYAYVTLHYTKD